VKYTHKKRRDKPKADVECCASPLNPSCGSRDILLYIIWHKQRLPICEECWRILAESDLEW
jgi:hypothetical protein